MQTDSYPFYPDYEIDRYEDVVLDGELCEEEDYDLIPQNEDEE